MLNHIRIPVLLIMLFLAVLKSGAQDTLEFKLLFPGYNDVISDEIDYTRAISSGSDVEELLDTIYDQLHGIGYLEASLDSCIYEQDDITCIMTPGIKYNYYIKQGNLSDELKYDLSSQEYFYPNGIKPAQYKNLVEEILAFFQKRGHPFANISLDNIEIDGDSISGSLNIDHSHHIVFDTLEVEGNVSIEPRFLAMHTGIKPGRSYSEDVLENLYNKLYALDFVVINREPEVLFTNTHAKVNVGLERRNANRFNGIAGVVYDDRAENAMRLTGQLNLFLINTLERGEWMDMKWQGLGFGTQTLDITGAYPYLFYTPLSAEMQFSMRKQDSTYIQINRKPALEFRFNNGIRTKAFIDRQTSELIEGQKYVNVTELPEYIDFNTMFYGVGLSYRSDLFYVDPRKGFNYSLQVAAGSREITENNNLPSHLYEDIELKLTQYKGEMLLQHIFPLFDQSAALFRVDAGMIYGGDVFDNEMYRIGGVNSLRGFDEEALLASTYGILLAEYRYVAGRNTYLGLFVNGGFVERRGESGYYNDWPVGAGAGITQELPAGIISLFFANGKRHNEPFNLNDIKVHVGFVSTF